MRLVGERREKEDADHASSSLETSMATLTLSLWDLMLRTGTASALWMKVRICSETALEWADCWPQGLLWWFIDLSNRLGPGCRCKSVSI